MSKLIFSGAIGIVLTLASGLWFCYEQVKGLQADNAILQESVKQVSESLLKEIERSSKVADKTAELAKKDDVRQSKFFKFERQLTNLKKSDDAVRSVLSVVIPRNALNGLRSFASGAASRRDTGAVKSDGADGVPGQ